MPKTLVLFHGSGDDVSALAEATAEGARGVRFAEVDVRRLGEPGDSGGNSRHQILSSVEDLAGYDGLVLGTAAGEALPPAIEQLLSAAGALRADRALGLSVGSVFVAGSMGDDLRWRLLRALGPLGVVLVPSGVTGAADGRELGHRVAHVVSWITHARSHHH